MRHAQVWGKPVPWQPPRIVEEIRMRYREIVAASLICSMVAVGASAVTARADGNIHNVNHIIIIMQENHSFDNYLGVLPYAPGSPYHGGACANSDHSCVDGLTCSFDMAGNLNC